LVTKNIVKNIAECMQMYIRAQLRIQVVSTKNL